MSDQRRIALSQTLAQPPAAVSGQGKAAWLSALKGRLPHYAAGVVLGILALAWIDGGAEPLHPIAEAVDLNSLPAENN